VRLAEGVRRRLQVLEQLREQRAVVHDRLPEIFGASHSVVARLSEGTRRAVVLHDRGVIDREIGGAGIEVLDGVAARPHHLGDELICPSRCADWVIDELCLEGAPRRVEARALCGGQIAKVKFFDTPGTLRELVFRARLAAVFTDGSLVFGPEALSEPRPLQLRAASHRYGSDDDDREHREA